MGQILAAVQEKFHGKQWKERQIRKITDRVFDHIRDESSDSRDGLTFEDVYIAVLCVYNDINKHLPGPHHDPPTKDKLRSLMKEYDVNLDGLLNREEFAEFIRKLTAETLTAISQSLIIALILAPTIALMTKRATEGVPGVGKMVQKLPNSIYASIITLGVLLAQKSTEGCE
ncbi:EF hand family protein [Musa troglodytarum]|uniref:EF hand family protein n=1 Tax=Musa troglodytarum TaxID=320322 RepID=A0A9E7F4K2_9LILI|nr:EF hand family protein [Musa troglodytarum]URD89616.1 EF hand family protein [Musa troglodytarum]URD89617.1 EF hand family protein [Musa troglodytarum]